MRTPLAPLLALTLLVAGATASAQSRPAHDALVGGKGPSVITGRYSAQWVKQRERWLIRSEVFVALTCACALDSSLASGSDHPYEWRSKEKKK